MSDMNLAQSTMFILLKKKGTGAKRGWGWSQNLEKNDSSSHCICWLVEDMAQSPQPLTIVLGTPIPQLSTAQT